MASTKISRAFSTATSSKKFTLSVWIKRSKLGSEQQIFSRSGGQAQLYLSSADKIQFYDQTSGHNFRTTRLFRDTNAWYHIVAAVDTTQSTASDRNKIYVNGVQETSFEVETNATQNNDTAYNISGITYDIGAYNNAYYWDGYMSHFHFIDGTMYDASPFGSTDSTTGEWKINTAPSVTYGNNGFFILKDGNSVTDQSGNSNNGTASGNLTDSEDCPSNVFATLNPLSCGSNIVFTNGNTGYQTHDAWESAPTTLAMSSGKYYCEFKPTSVLAGGSSFIMFGVEEPKNVNAWINQYPGYTGTGYAYGWDGNKRNNAGNTSYGNSFSQNDIIGIALDMDNKKLYFHKNGTYQNSGDPTSGSTGTGALSLTGDEYYFVVSGYNNGANATCKSNFGNGYFGTSAVSSAGTNASGIGIFEYDVPTGYTALSTKGLNE